MPRCSIRLVFLLSALSLNALADQLVNDDLIVQGGACYGVDCVNGEVFNSDTVILKENNLRIKFNDSNSAENDYRITANEKNNGGNNLFQIDTDLHEADLNATLTDPVTLNHFVDSIVAVQPDGRLLIIDFNGGASSSFQSPDGSDITADLSTINGSYIDAGDWQQDTGNPNLYTINAGSQFKDAAGNNIQIHYTFAKALISISPGGDSIALGENSERISGAVSVGSSGSEQRISNVAEGQADTDILTVGQVQSVDIFRSTTSDVQQKFDGQLIRFHALEVQLDTLNKRLDSIGAMASAFSALKPNGRATGENQLAIGLGDFKSVQAIAVGYYRYLDNGSLFNAGLSATSSFDESSAQVGWTLLW